jgi:hypothetical protein
MASTGTILQEFQNYNAEGDFNPREDALGAHWTADWVGTTVGLDALEKRQSPAPAGRRAIYSSVFLVTSTDQSRLGSNRNWIFIVR